MSEKIDKKIRFALIGCGAISNKHIAAIARLSDAEVVGAYDIDCAAANIFEKKYHIPTFTNVEKMIKEKNPDVLNILTPSGDHARRILELVHFNKHFVVEKPLALRVEDIDKAIKECDSRNVKIFVVKQNRFNPPVQKLKEALDNGRFGKLVVGTVRVRWMRDQAYYDKKPWRGTWAYDGGVLANQASHHIDMLIWMMGEVESVMAKISTRLVNIETEDTGVAILKFKNGALGLIEATTATRPKDLEGSLSILGEKGTVEIAGFFMNELKTWNFIDSDKIDEDIWNKFAKVPDEVAWNHTEFFKDVIKVIMNDGRGLIDGREGRKSVELINAIYESALKGKEVFLTSMKRKVSIDLIENK